MARLAYEGAAELYDRALHALEEIDDEFPDRDDQAAELLIARCEALLAAGDVASAAGAVSQLQGATVRFGPACGMGDVLRRPTLDADPSRATGRGRGRGGRGRRQAGRI